MSTAHRSVVSGARALDLRLIGRASSVPGLSVSNRRQVVRGFSEPAGTFPTAERHSRLAGTGVQTSCLLYYPPALGPVVYWGVYAGIRRIPTSGVFLTAYTHLSDHK